MYDGGKIIPGLIIFLALATFPFWNGMGRAAKKPDPKTDTPVIKKLKEKKCVEATPFMRKSHMILLDEWRDKALREGERVYIGSDGQHRTISLQNTCMNCHSNKTKFCDECHNYAAVSPYCWSCHIEPKEEKKA